MLTVIKLIAEVARAVVPGATVEVDRFQQVARVYHPDGSELGSIDTRMVAAEHCERTPSGVPHHRIPPPEPELRLTAKGRHMIALFVRKWAEEGEAERRRHAEERIAQIRNDPRWDVPGSYPASSI